MKYALCLRGINYIKDYMHDYKPGMTPYTIDFKESIPYLYKFIILPLEKAGHTVDIFFVTYETEKLKEFVNLLEPKEVKISSFNPYVTSYHWKNIYQLMIDSLKLVDNYSTNKKVNYDYTIISRFDTIYVESITNLFLEPNGVSFPAPRDDCCFIIGKDLNNKIISILEHMLNTDLISHDCSSFFAQKGIPCHALYGNKIIGENYPFSRISRQHFVPSHHLYFTCNIKEIFDPNSKYYVYRHKPMTEFTPC